MAEIEKVSLTCKCGHKFQCKAPSMPGSYFVTCTNPACKAQIRFHYPVTAEQKQAEPKTEVKFGLLDDGSYRFRCENNQCRQTVLVPANMIKVGLNRVKCPKCSTYHEFNIKPKESDLLKCQTVDCDGLLVKPDRGDGIYSSVCDKCGQEYSIIIQSGEIYKVIMKTPLPPSPIKSVKMKLVLGRFLGRKEYELSKGTHYVGRLDSANNSDLAIKDKFASSKSLRIDVNENGGSLVYRMTVERAMNPVYHNNRELMVGDIVYLTYGDTLRLGKTLVKIEKIKSS
jgi:hypothetical protein